MKLNINEKKALYTFGCPNHKATVDRLRLLAAITPDPAAGKLFCNLAVKLSAVGVGKWYRCFFHTLRMEMEGLSSELKITAEDFNASVSDGEFASLNDVKKASRIGF